MKFKKSKDGDKRLTFEDKCGDVLAIDLYAESDHMYVRVNDGVGVQIKRRRAVRLALMILDELDPLHTWA